MMKNYLISLLLLSSGLLQAQEKLWKPWYVNPRSSEQHINLDGKWQLSYRDTPITDFSQLKSQENFETSIPSSIHWSLYNAGKLPHPYYNKNSDKYKWVDEKVWYYTKNFNLKNIQGDNYIYLCFDGLDYFSKVWVNGKLLGVHEGMFGGPNIEISKNIISGNNSIVVELKAGNWENKAADFDNLPRTATGDRDFTGRKGYNSRASGKIIKPWLISGGSGTEMFFSLGMWRSVRLDIVPKIHLERPFITTTKIELNKALLHFSTEVFANIDELNEKLHPTYNTGIRHPKDKGYPFIPINEKMSLLIEFYSGKKKAFSKEIPIKIFEGHNWLEENIEIENPELWNPIGLGPPNLYRVSCTLKNNDNEVDKISFDYGIRSIERIESAGPRLADNWENWQFIVNGKKIFVKGMNFTPQDVLLETNEEKYRWTLTAAKNMGVQLIRVWGGGLIETDDFYKICDELGLMVWQDFPIGNQDTPDYPQDIWESQVVQNIYRLRNHPSLAIWCGGNEFNPYTVGNAATIGILERNLKILDPSRLFLRATPDGGSIHVYPDMDPSWYNKSFKFEPWISETGMHSMPEAKMLKEVVLNSELNDVGNMWDKKFPETHPDFVHHFAEYGAARVPRMLNRASHIANMGNPSIESITEATQIGAAEFYQVLSDKVQMNYPITTGLMPWVFKRPWPVVGIQFMDWFGQVNAPYYFLKRTYEPLHIAVDIPRLLWAPGENVDLNIKVINTPNYTSNKIKATVTVYNDAFKQLWNTEKLVTIADTSSVSSLSFGSFKIPNDYTDRFFFILTELHAEDGELLSRSFYYPRSLSKMTDTSFYNKYIAEPIPWPSLEKGPWLKPTVAKTTTKLNVSAFKELKINSKQSKISITISNKGNYPAFLVSIDIEGTKRVMVSNDNYFWLAPGETKEIQTDVMWQEDRKPAHITISSWNSNINKIKL